MNYSIGIEYLSLSVESSLIGPLFNNFEFLLQDYTALGKNFVSRFLSDNTLAKFREGIPSVFQEDSYANVSSSKTDNLVYSATG